MEDEKKIKAAEAAKENERKTEEAVKKSTGVHLDKDTTSIPR